MLAFIAITPAGLLTIVGVILVARILLSLRPVRVGSQGRSTAFAREYLDPFIVAGVAAFLLITFVARTYYIPSASMVPTLAVGDVLLVDKFEYRFRPPHEGDIVVFPPPIPNPGNDDFIKRVIGRPGDRFRVHNGVVYVNGIALKERYVAEPPDYDLEVKNYGVYVSPTGEPNGEMTPLDPEHANIPPHKDWTAPDRIPPHCYIMMGDNRTDSEDSHYWGFAQDSGKFATGEKAGQPAGFTGRAFLIFWPLNHLKII